MPQKCGGRPCWGGGLTALPHILQLNFRGLLHSQKWKGGEGRVKGKKVKEVYSC